MKRAIRKCERRERSSLMRCPEPDWMRRSTTFLPRRRASDLRVIFIIKWHSIQPSSRPPPGTAALCGASRQQRREQARREVARLRDRREKQYCTILVLVKYFVI